MLIEFVGMPGVGKTTLAREVAAELGRQGYDPVFLPMDAPPAMNRHLKLARQCAAIGNYALWHPEQTRRAVAVLRRLPQPGFLMYTKVLRYWLLTHAVAARLAGRSDVTIIDQGICQGLYSLALTTPTVSAEVLTSVLARIPRPELAILVVADRATVRDRLHARKHRHRRIDRLLTESREREAWLEKSEHIMGDIEHALAAAGQPLIRFRNGAETPLALVTQQLAAMLEKRLSTADDGRLASARAARA